MADAPTGALRALSARRIIGFIADAAERWSDADFAPRVRATHAIAKRLRYSEPVVDYALDRLFFGITRDALTATIASELGSVDALDGVVARAGAPAAWARGVDRVAIVSSDTTIGVALIPAIFALCAKCDVVVKDRSDALVSEFFGSLAEEHPGFASAATAKTWRGGDDADEAGILAAADVVVAFGRDEALRAIRARCATEARFVPFGHRASVGRLTRDDVAALDDELADRIVRDALLYDGEGCLSLHALFVDAGNEEARAAPGGDVRRSIAATLAAACERVGVEFPAVARSPDADAPVAAYRNLAAFRAASGRGGVYRAGGATLVADASHDDPPPLLPRVLPLYAGDDDALAAYVAAHRLPVQALGVVTPDERAVALAQRVGAVRVAPFGTLQDPPLAGHHGGAPRIADFIRWLDAR
ncbi:MAG TPA: acyl-CoA reductase [Candidatus Baltobacteraceae bacterium]|nr:acyl-CoA reductase [Candidatus Baltobacteraceae bacterium]